MNPLPQGPVSRRPGRVGRVVVVNDVSVMRGGATGVALTSARMICDRDVPVTFVTGDGAENLSAADAGITFEALGGRHILEGHRANAALRGLYNFDTRDRLARFVRDTDTPDTVYHLHGWSKILSPSVFHALSPVADRLVVAAHDFFLTCPNGGSFDFRREEPCELRPMSGSCLSRNCDRRNYGHKLWRSLRQGVRRTQIDFGNTRAIVLAVHEEMIPHLERGGIARERMKALRNPVMPWRTQRVQAENNTSFLFVGRLEQDKGVDLLARAAKRAGVPLRIVGGGPLDAMLSAEHPEIERLGWRDREEIGALVESARCLVMPTRYREAFGIVALEASMSGIPIVLPDHAMLAPEIIAGGFGLTCNPHDEGALAATLRQLASSDDEVAAMSWRGHTLARSLAPTPENWVDALLDLYAERLRSAQVGHSAIRPLSDADSISTSHEAIVRAACNPTHFMTGSFRS